MFMNTVICYRGIQQCHYVNVCMAAPHTPLPSLILPRVPRLLIALSTAVIVFDFNIMLRLLLLLLL